MCDSCQTVHGTYESGIEDDFHECDFVDGKCPHGSDIVWWLQQPAEEDDMTDCKHEFVYDELHGEIVCKFCGYVLTADDKRELHRKAFELMEDEEGAD